MPLARPMALAEGECAREPAESSHGGHDHSSIRMTRPPRTRRFLPDMPWWVILFFVVGVRASFATGRRSIPVGRASSCDLQCLAPCSGHRRRVLEGGRGSDRHDRHADPGLADPDRGRSGPVALTPVLLEFVRRSEPCTNKIFKCSTNTITGAMRASLALPHGSPMSSSSHPARSRTEGCAARSSTRLLGGSARSLKVVHAGCPSYQRPTTKGRSRSQGT
jgi:hypothetical protein